MFRTRYNFGVVPDARTAAVVAVTLASLVLVGTISLAGGLRAATDWAFNEIYALPGDDANGDGRVDPADAFVELVNLADSEENVSGFAIVADGEVVHSFSNGFRVRRGCAAVVFAGGPILRDLGGADAEVASSGGLDLTRVARLSLIDREQRPRADVSLVGLMAVGASVTLTPDLHGTHYAEHPAVGIENGRSSPGRRRDGARFVGCRAPPRTAEIWQLQGAGARSPYAFEHISVPRSVVTAILPRGLFVQTPQGRSDDDPQTSDALFVKVTGGRSSVGVGDIVALRGLIVEDGGLTQLAGTVEVEVVGRGRVPEPVGLTGAALLESVTTEAEAATILERYEGMLVALAQTTVTSPTNALGNAAITLTGRRAFREPGLAFPGLPGLPTWDGNPEVLTFRPGAVQPASPRLIAGARLARCVGLLSSQLGAYEILPIHYHVASESHPRGVRARRRGEFTIATQNLLLLVDDETDAATGRRGVDGRTYQRRLTKHATAVRDMLQLPDILAVQEVENLQTLSALARRVETLASDGAAIGYRAFLAEGRDPSGIDVGFLVRDSIAVESVEQIGSDALFAFEGELHATFSRPPLVLHCQAPSAPLVESTSLSLTVVNVHLRSRRGIENGSFAPTKRKAQAEWLARWIQSFQSGERDRALVVTGDFNAFEFSDGHVDVVGEISGTARLGEAILPATESVAPPLENVVLRLPPGERYSFIFRGSAQTLDHTLVSSRLAPFVTGVEFARSNADFPTALAASASTPVRASDHDGLVVYFSAATLGPRAPGDVNSDATVDISDAVFLLRYLFAGGPAPNHLSAADLNADGRVDVTDVRQLLRRVVGRPET